MANEKRLTEKDKIAYSAILKFIEENGYPPSVRELCRITGKASTATIQYRLKSLEQKGYIKTTNGGKRTIRITKQNEDTPTVDAVEVVRCKDCKHRYTMSSGHSFCRENFPLGKYDDDFCSYGERKDYV